jgi:hypothetical protein
MESDGFGSLSALNWKIYHSIIVLGLPLACTSIAIKTLINFSTPEVCAERENLPELFSDVLSRNEITERAREKLTSNRSDANSASSCMS